MEKYNIVFVKNRNCEREILGRRAQDYVYREFADFSASIIREVDTSFVKEEVFLDDYVNVALALDMPLVKKEDVTELVRQMKTRGLSRVKLGGRDSASEIRFGKRANGSVFSSSVAFFDIGDAKSYNVVYNRLKDDILDGLLKKGVYVLDKYTTFVDDTASVEKGVAILPYCRIEGATALLNGASVVGSYIRDSVIDGASIEYSHIVCSHVHARATVGPFARLRRADVGEECRVGDFVEIKASALSRGVKCAHLSYVGDASVGEKTNVGCGTVFCNYDGVNKHKSTVGAGCFIGANTNLIAPINVGDGAFIAAGTTVTKNVDDGEFAIGRVRQASKPRKNNAIEKDNRD